MEIDPFEKAFGKKPEKGYKFNYVEVEICHTWFKGFIIRWSAQGIGFGEVSVGWGTKPENAKYNQYGFYCDSEYSSREFLEALMKEAFPQIIDYMVDYDICDGKKPMSEEDYLKICEGRRKHE